MSGRVTSVSADLMRSPHPWLNGLMITSLSVLLIFVAWAYFAEIDEVVRGMGQVEPSQSLQKVQHLEGGILAEMLVEEGDNVVAGQVIAVVDDTGLTSRLREDTQRYYSLLGTIARLTAEIEGVEPVLPPEIAEGRNDILRREQELYDSRQAQLRNGLTILEQQVRQREDERAGFLQQYQNLEQSISLTVQELNLLEESYYLGAASTIQVLQKRREVNDLVTQRDSAQNSYRRTEAALLEARERVEEHQRGFVSDALSQRNDLEGEVSIIRETIIAAQDRVDRTEVRAPIDGRVNQIYVTTIGGVLAPGSDLIDIVPEEDSLLVEARILPRDRGTLVPGQNVNVKITTFDFAIWGSLEGVLENISPDTVTNDRGETYYVARVRTGETFLERNNGDRESILPGMEAQIDILTGTRTVLNYILKPIERAMANALTER